VGDVTPSRDQTGSARNGRGVLGSLLRRRRAATAGEPVYQITSARPGVRDDVDSRTRRYLISMGVRTACFLGAVFTGGWLRWVLIAGALVLPYLSVVFANGGRERVEDATSFHDEQFRAITGPDH
jgi:Protein of unknown function (DUF3099)